MMMTITPGEPPVSLNEARGWMRLGTSIDDAVVAALIRAATNVCENFIGQLLIVRAVEEVMPIRPAAMRLTQRPVVAVDTVTALTTGAPDMVLAAEDYRLSVARDGTGQVTVDVPGGAERVRVAYRAGLAEAANGIPEALRQGIIRMTQHLYAARDMAQGEPPVIITALWQPWRQVTLRIGLGR